MHFLINKIVSQGKEKVL